MREVGWSLVLMGALMFVSPLAVVSPLPFISTLQDLIFVGLFISPLQAFLVFGVGLIILAIRRPERGWRRPCPFCGEQIKAEAALCPHCRSEVPQETVRARWEDYKARYRDYVKTRAR
jgi:energy-converting hydrogenase Eha subunit F